MQSILKNTLITGGQGMLASYINFGIKTDSSSLDVTDFKNVISELKRIKPKVVVHLAAVTDMNKCETDPKLVFNVNAVGTYNIAITAKSINAKVIYISTDAVFDGEKDDAYIPQDIAKPSNIYGHSKYLGELAVLGLDHRNLVVRTSWIFGGGQEKDKKFLGKIIPKLHQNEPVDAVNDVFGTPTYGKDLAIKLKELIKKDITGIIHVVNQGKASRYDMAIATKEFLNSKSNVKGVPMSSFKNLSNTLKNEMLDAGENSLRDWRDALKEYIETEWKNIK